MIGLVQHPDEPTLDQVIEKILPTQKAYISSPDRYTSYVGGFRSGKTVAGSTKTILFAQENPGMYLIGRMNAPALQATTMRTFLSILPRDWVEHYDKGNKIVTLKTGSQFIFRHLDVPDLHQHLRSLNLRGFFVDEGSEVQEAIFQMLMGRLSTGATRFGTVTSNPEGRNWLWRRFFDPNRPPKWQQMFKGFHAPSSENTNLPADYVDDLKNGCPEDWFDRYVNASFAELSGAVYPEWSPLTHVYDSTQKWDFFQGLSNPPDSWPTWVGLDIGGIDPWAFSFWKFAPNGMAFKFDEIHQSGVFISELADLYFKKLGNSNLVGMAFDYENQQAAFELTRYNVNGDRAIKDVKPGIFSVSHYMHIYPNLINPFTGEKGSPMFFVSAACENTIREYNDWKWERDRAGRPTGSPVDKDNHQCDADRYMFHTFHPIGERVREKKAYENEELDTASRLYYWEVQKEEERAARSRKKPFTSGYGILRRRTR